MERQDTQLTQTGAEVQALLDKVEGIESGAEVNTIESVMVNGVGVVPDSNKAVNITVPVIVALSNGEIDELWDA